jgi:MOSC domain-containing protein YiiM
MAARAASVAKPWPQAVLTSRQPTSTAGAGGDVGAHGREPGGAEKDAVASSLDDPDAKAKLIELGVQPRQQGFRLGASLAAAQPEGHLGIGHHGGVGRQVRLAPASQNQSRGLDHAGRGAVSAP